MTFEEWWLSQPLDIRKMGPTMVDVKAAWDAATKVERDRCAQVCESFGGNGQGYIDDDWARMCAAAVRERDL